MKFLQRFYPECLAGGFTRHDGSAQFFLRVNALLEPGMTVVDLGAGRGAFSDSDIVMNRKLATLKGKVREVIGIDIDPAVMENPSLDRALVYDGVTIPLPDNSVDMIVSDHVFEHVTDPERFVAEMDRILKPGGWVCARTPYIISLVVMGASLVPNRMHSRALRKSQPSRESFDVFPTVYKLNSFSRLKRHFPPSHWDNASYNFSPEPAYHFNNPWIFRAMLVYDAIKRPLLGGEVLMVFMRKKAV